MIHWRSWKVSHDHPCGVLLQWALCNDPGVVQSLPVQTIICITFTKWWSSSLLALHLLLGSGSKQCARNAWPSKLRASFGKDGLFPIPSWYMIWNWLSKSDQGSYSKRGRERERERERERDFSNWWQFCYANLKKHIHNTVEKHTPHTHSTHPPPSPLTFPVAISTTTQPTLHMSIGRPISCFRITSGDM